MGCLRVRKFIICVCLIAFPGLIFGIRSSTDLTVVSHGLLPEKGEVEYGVINKIYEIDNKLRYTQSYFFMKYALSDWLQSSVSTTKDFDALLGVSAQVFRLKWGDTTHRLVYGYKNLGWDYSQTVLTSLPVIHQFSVYSISVPKWRSHYHVGLARYKNFTHDMMYFAAHYDFPYITTMAEWDGKQVHFGARFTLSEDVRFNVSLTPSPYKDFGNYYHYVSFGLTLRQNVFKSLLLEKKKVEKLEQEYVDINKKLAVMNAKMDVVREFSSLDFLEEFQQFMLEEHLVEKELNKESKEMVKTALEHMQRGLEFYYLGQYEMAKNEYQLVTSLMPRLSIGFSRLGSIYYKLNDLDKAREYWEEALRLDPANKGLEVFLKRVTPASEQVKKGTDTQEQSTEKNKIESLPGMQSL